MMERANPFNIFFTEGYDYFTYINRSDRQKGRMEANWNETIPLFGQLDPVVKEHLDYPMKILVIAENWCSDSGNAVPIIAYLAEKFENWELKIIGKDDIITRDEYLSNYLVAGKQKIPVIVFADVLGEEISRWNEKPLSSYKYIYELKHQNLDNEEYQKKIKDISDLQVPVVTRKIFEELIYNAEKSVLIAKLNSMKNEVLVKT